MEKEHIKRDITAIKVTQWLKGWDKVIFNDEQHRRKPLPHFYIFSLPANNLKLLSGIYRRPTEDGLQRESALNIQRRHNKERSKEIREFILRGYPLSEISEANRKSGKFDDLRKPGWLPTAIVINILRHEDIRLGERVATKDLIKIIENGDNSAKIILPETFYGLGWKPAKRHPIEVIDGQHRLWAFEDGITNGNYELPVVAFYGLDISWQAYLFWVINIKPKRINASLAFDLYPLLRTEDWLEKFEGPKIYRETRAQELTEALWSYPESAWYNRIDMLGEHRQTMVSQAAWINSLLSTFIKPWEGRGVRGIGGLYGAPIGKDDLVLPWTRTQQAAFIIYIWNTLRNVIIQSKEIWAESLRKTGQKLLFGEYDLAFAGPSSLLNTDQGVRGVLFIFNDLCFLLDEMEMISLQQWIVEDLEESDEETTFISEENLTRSYNSLVRVRKIVSFIKEIATILAEFDWRTASAENLTDDEKTMKLVFRGSGGYRELRRQLLKHLMKYRNTSGKVASLVYDRIGFE
jgi:DGQHR domain-containing protein